MTEADTPLDFSEGQASLCTLFLLLCLEDDRCGPDGEDCAVGDDAAFAVAKDYVVDESAGVARTVAQDVFQVALLVAAYVDDAVGEVYRRVVGLDRSVDAACLMVAAYHVVAHTQRQLLLEVENILDDNDASESLFLLG